MGSNTGIAWTDATWNPWMGCTRVSPGCAHCYMFREQSRFGNDPEVVRRSKTTFRDPLKWREPRRVFTCSWSDWFHEGADPWRDEAWDIIRRTPHLTYQILTKRPERIEAHLPSDWGTGWPNVWIGVSVENQRMAAERIPQLIAIPAALRFLSCEPLLGPLDIESYIKPRLDRVLPPTAKLIQWVIAGGESGPLARPMALSWARDLRDQCNRAAVAFFLKQLGGWPDARAHREAVLDGRRWTDMPEQEIVN